ncbi:glyoxalase superfamily protein [uncultured Tateyamaria sp.]|uniref:glyoxalase superfamily protein n=1 Tax=uncultured Tateyamaria sp. TaxID=455651 RepID=UPI00262A8970|nr:glyoxalase superfamily protein [uncultured Tateyamaria sp.]
MLFHPAIPIFRCFDERLARDFYLGFLGFVETFAFRQDRDGPLCLGVQLGKCRLHLSEFFGDASPGGSIRIEMDDVHGFCAAVLAKDDPHARPEVQRQPWGMDDMTMSDPFGNRLIFCTDIPDGAG